MTNQTQQDLNILKATRSNILELIKDLTFEQLTTIPNQFSNSILWNFVHLTVTEQLLCYGLSENEMTLDATIIDNFRKGSSGSNTMTESEFEEIKKLFIAQPLQLEKDFDKMTTSNYKEYATSYNFTLSSLEDAVRFNNAHEAMHYGIILSLKKLV